MSNIEEPEVDPADESLFAASDHDLPPDKTFNHLTAEGSLTVGNPSKCTDDISAYIVGDQRIENGNLYLPLSLTFSSKDAPDVKDKPTLSIVGQLEGQLQLNGSLQITDTLRINQPVGIGTSPGSQAQLRIQGTGDHDLQVWQDKSATPVITVDGGGKMGLGTSEPAARFTIRGMFSQKVGSVHLTAHSDKVKANPGTTFASLEDDELVHFPALSADHQTFTITKKNADGTLTLDPNPYLSADKPNIDMYTDATLFQVQSGDQSPRLTVTSRGRVSIGKLFVSQNLLVENELRVLGEVKFPNWKVSKDQVSFNAGQIGGLTSTSTLDGAKLKSNSVSATAVSFKADDIGGLTSASPLDGAKLKLKSVGKDQVSFNASQIGGLEGRQGYKLSIGSIR